MTRIANPFRYKFREDLPSQPSVYKLWFGKKFLILKCKALHQSVQQVSIELDRRLRLGTKPNDIYAKTTEHIKRARITIMEVEVLCQPESPLELLKCEWRASHKALLDPNCLNVPMPQMFPAWIPEAIIEEFKKWRTKQQKDERKKENSSASKVWFTKTQNAKARDKGVSNRKAPVPVRGRNSDKLRAVQKKSGPQQKKPAGRGNK